jgi:hypothetical protein
MQKRYRIEKSTKYFLRRCTALKFSPQIPRRNRKHFALALLCIQKHKWQVRKLTLQNFASRAEFADQQSGFGQMLFGVFQYAAFEVDAVLAGDVGSVRFTTAFLFCIVFQCPIEKIP